MAQQQEVELTAQDINKVKASIRNTVLFVLIVAAVGVSIVYFMTDGLAPILVLSIFMAFLLFIASTSISSMRGILEQNKKIIVKGTITNERQQRVGVGRGSRTNFYKTIDNYELQVDANVNKRYRVGNAVEIHYALNGRMLPYVFVDKLLSA